MLASARRTGGLAESLRAEDISLVSHIHGRERRAERNILRQELQSAVKHGTIERANPGRDGSTRWRYTHNGVVYITDESSRHEITSWRIDGKEDDTVADAEVNLDGRGSHVVLIVDSSGSMRKDDVPGYASRTQAVYDCLSRDFVEAQVSQGIHGEDVVVSLISMSNEATVLLDKRPLDSSLVPILKMLGDHSPRSHGNYVPALDKAIEIMINDAPNRANLLLLFLSDGAPSDHTAGHCEHGEKVWQFHESRCRLWRCRDAVKQRKQVDCIARIRRMGDIFGKDKVVLCTVGFGPANEDFKVLNEMASALPRGSFQKLGLNAAGLRTVFSSLSR